MSVETTSVPRLDLLVVGRGAPQSGGIPTFLDWLLWRARKAGMKVDLLNLNLTTTREDTRAWHFLADARRTLSDGRRVLTGARRARIVHVHSAGSPAGTLVRLGFLCAAARVGGARVVAHLHGGRLPLWATTKRRARLVRWALRPADRVVTVAEAGAAVAQRAVGWPRVHLIKNGVDCEKFRPAPVDPSERTGPPVLLFVGGLTQRKGVLDLFEASELLRGEGVAHRLVLVGGRPDEGEGALREVLNRVPEPSSGEPPWVELMGNVDVADMPAVYQRGDVFCLPSWWEAMPLSVLEAMASGLPVVATEVGDVPHMVKDGCTGRVVPIGDPVVLAAALRPLLTDAHQRRNQGAAGRERALRLFDDRSTWRQLQEVYESLFSERESRGSTVRKTVDPTVADPPLLRSRWTTISEDQS